MKYPYLVLVLAGLLWALNAGKSSTLNRAVHRKLYLSGRKSGAGPNPVRRIPVLGLPRIVYENEFRFNIVKASGEIAEAGLKPGGWKPFVKPEGDALKVFDEALKGLVGVGYKPLLVSSQVVNGANYIYAVNGTVVYPGAVEFPALLGVYAPSGGKARITHITRLDEPPAHSRR